MVRVVISALPQTKILWALTTTREERMHGHAQQKRCPEVAAGALPLIATGSAIAQPVRAKKVLILSCDGGGIRGLLTALIIERLQKEVPFLAGLICSREHPRAESSRWPWHITSPRAIW